MPLIINTNVQSMNSQRQLVKSGMEMSTAMERLSSGKRINSAADDAAGLAIASRMTSQIRGLSQAVRNANDGISLIQVAGGALGESTNILQRMRELAIQSSNGIYTDANRTSLNAELNQLKSELTRIAETTSFNGLKVLDGTLGDIGLQIGAEAGETINLNIGSGFTADKLGANETTVSSGTFTLAEANSTGLNGTSGTLSALKEGDLTINGVAVPAVDGTLDSVSYSDNTASAISLASVINSVSQETGVTAVATNSINLGAYTNAALTAGDLVINGVDIVDATGTEASLLAAINAKTATTGVVATVESSKVVLTAVDGRNIQLKTDAATTTATFANFNLNSGSAIDNTYSGSVQLKSNEAINVGGNNPADFGFTAGATAATATSALQNTTTGSTALINATYVASGTYELVINGVSTGAITANTDAPTTEGLLITAINDIAERTGVTAELSGTDIKLSGLGDIDISLKAGGAATAALALTAASDGSANTTATATSATVVTATTSVSEKDGTNFDKLFDGDLTINGYSVDFSYAKANIGTNEELSLVGDQASAQFTAWAINNTADLSGEVEATATTVANLGKVTAATTADNFGLIVNGTFIDLDQNILADDSNGYLVGELNAAFAEAGVNTTANATYYNANAAGLVASLDENNNLIITADDGRNITVQTYNSTTVAVNVLDNDNAGVDATVNGTSFLSNFDVTKQNAVTAKGTVAVNAKEGFSLGEIGGDRRALAGIANENASVATTDISTQAGAQAAISVFDRAIDTINTATGNLGAANNRLDFTVSNLSAIIENAAASRSAIMDADFAMETAQLSRAQVLQQAASAMLAQANALPSQVLSLLR